MAIVFLQYSYLCTNEPIPFCIPEGILTQIFTWGRTRRGEFSHFLRNYGYGIKTQGLELGGTLSFYKHANKCLQVYTVDVDLQLRDLRVWPKALVHRLVNPLCYNVKQLNHDGVFSFENVLNERRPP